MLSNLIKKNIMLYLHRLVKPNISQYESLQSLEYDQRQRELAQIQQMNVQKLERNKTFTVQKMISSSLNLSAQTSSTILKSHITFSGISPISLNHHSIKQPLNNQTPEYPFSLQQVQANLPNFHSIPMHFSYKRGVAIIPQYEIDKKTAFVFNLPEDFSTKEISQKIGLETIKQIKVEYCKLGLPAYAKIHFNSDQAITNIVLNSKTFIQLNGKICYIKTHFDTQKLAIKNRRLVIKNLSTQHQHEKDLIIRLSEYGRVIHFDYPTFVARNVSLEQVKEHYKKENKGQALFKINFHRQDGSIESEYYPSSQELSSSNADFQATIIQKKQHQRATYKNRMRYSHQIDVYEGRQNQITIKNMGYCVVTYSTVQQAQNSYFGFRLTNKVQLLADKQEFQLDDSYRMRVLRFVDNQYRLAKQLALKTNKNSNNNQFQFNSVSMFQQLVDLEYQQKTLREKVAFDRTEQDLEAFLAVHKARINEIKSQLQQKLGSKSFDQMAQKQLFGRILPKKSLTNSSLDILPEHSSEAKQILSYQGLTAFTSEQVAQRDKLVSGLKYRAQFVRNKQSKQQQLLDLQEAGEEGEEGKQAEAPEVVDDEFTGQRGFSTLKKVPHYFRPRNSIEHANYILRYCQFIRNIINQYQGVFSEDRLKAKTQLKGTYLSPQRLQFSDGTQYLTENDLGKALECLRDHKKAQEIYTNFWKDLQIFKSKNIDIKEFIHNIRNRSALVLQRYTDNGLVKQVYEVQENQDIQTKVKYLNSTIASFGQQFRIHHNESGRVIVKVSKLEHIYPLDRIKLIDQAKQKFQLENTVTDERLKLFEKYKYQIIETGQIPDQVRKQFNIPQDKTLDDLFEQLANQAGIYKKDIQCLLNLQNFTQEQIQQDIGLQIQLEKERVLQRQSKASHYAKDPSEIGIRDKQGYMKVSKFRQI